MKTPEEIAAEIILLDDWDNTEGLRGHPILYETLKSHIAAALRTYGAQERERCVRAMCRMCREDAPFERGRHFVNDGLQPRGQPGRWVMCAAHSIRALPND
jgi:hypothetical protein